MLIICDAGMESRLETDLCLASLPSVPQSHGCFLLKQNIINNSGLFLNPTLERVVRLRGTGSGGCAAGVGAALPLPPALWLLLAAKSSPAVVRSPGWCWFGGAQGRSCFPGGGLGTF